MGIFFRKSLSLGPVRVNFTKSGVGMSAGVRGFRAGVNSRGKSYIAGGRHGIYFRHSLSDSEPETRNVEAGGGWLGMIVVLFLLGFLVAKLIG